MLSAKSRNPPLALSLPIPFSGTTTAASTDVGQIGSGERSDIHHIGPRCFALCVGVDVKFLSVAWCVVFCMLD